MKDQHTYDFVKEENTSSKVRAQGFWYTTHSDLWIRFELLLSEGKCIRCFKGACEWNLIFKPWAINDDSRCIHVFLSFRRVQGQLIDNYVVSYMCGLWTFFFSFVTFMSAFFSKIVYKIEILKHDFDFQLNVWFSTSSNVDKNSNAILKKKKKTLQIR